MNKKSKFDKLDTVSTSRIKEYHNTCYWVIDKSKIAPQSRQARFLGMNKVIPSLTAKKIG